MILPIYDNCGNLEEDKGRDQCNSGGDVFRGRLLCKYIRSYQPMVQLLVVYGDGDQQEGYCAIE